VYDLPLLLNTTANETLLHKSGTVRNFAGYLSLGFRPAVTGRLPAIGQNVLQSYFQTGNIGSPWYFNILFIFGISLGGLN
jgi:hypothetical protein